MGEQLWRNNASATFAYSLTLLHLSLQYYIENKDQISIPSWNPKPIYFPPTSPKKSTPPLKAGAGLERAAMSLKAKREEREAKESRRSFGKHSGEATK